MSTEPTDSRNTTTADPDGRPASEASDSKQDGDGERPPGPRESPPDAGDDLSKKIVEATQGAAQQAEDISERLTGQINALISGGTFHIAGDFVSGSKGVSSSGATTDGDAITGLSASLELEKLETVFVEPAEHQQAKHILGQQHLVVLGGSAGIGKRAMALHLLQDQGTKRVVELSPDTDPASLATYRFARQYGYMIDSMSLEPAKQLSSFMLRRLSAVLRDHNSYLVATIRHWPGVSPKVAREYLVDCVDAPDRAVMLKHHLDWYLRGTEFNADGRPELGEDVVLDYLRMHPGPASVDRLAQLLRPVVLGQRDLAIALRQAGSVATEQAASIFANDPDLQQWSFNVALAVLHGASYQTVLNAAEVLAGHLHPTEGSDKTKSWNPGIPRAQRLSQAKARLINDDEMLQYGLVQVERVEFECPELQSAVLDHVWQRYDQLRTPLLDWLRELGADDTREVQVGTATAVGYLLTHAFRHLFNTLIWPWALSDDDATRTTAALAFGVPIRYEQLAPVVLAILKDWAGPDSAWQFRWAAAESYGRAVGAQHPDAALRDLRLIGKSDDAELTWITGRGVSYLAINGQITQVLDALLDWTAPGQARSLRTTGLLGFVQLATRVTRSSKMPGHSSVLLEVAAKDKALHKPVVTLWRRVFGAAFTVDYAAYALRDWLRVAEREIEHLTVGDAELEPWLHGLLVDLLAPDASGTAQRLRYYLRRWSNDSDRPSPLARKVLGTPTVKGGTA
jgi:hypothetical protein